MAVVHAWPPVAARSQGWHVDDPLSSSRSLLSGRRYGSQHERRRRVVRLSVGGALFGGYMEAISRLLRGGQHLVRLRSHPLIWAPTDPHGAEPMAWFSQADPMSWRTGGDPMVWWTGEVYEAALATVDGFPAVLVSGLPPQTRVIQVGEFVGVRGDLGVETRMALRDGISDGAGIATIVVDEAFSSSGTATLASSETVVAEPITIPRPSRTVGEEWYYDWDFREVFADEVGGFEEVDPW